MGSAGRRVRGGVSRKEGEGRANGKEGEGWDQQEEG